MPELRGTTHNGLVRASTKEAYSNALRRQRFLKSVEVSLPALRSSISIDRMAKAVEPGLAALLSVPVC